MCATLHVICVCHARKCVCHACVCVFVGVSALVNMKTASALS